MAIDAIPFRQLFVELIAEYNRSLGGSAPDKAIDTPEASVTSVCSGVEFTLSHSTERRPHLLRIACDFGALPADGARQPVLTRLLEIQHRIAWVSSMLSVDPASGKVYHTIALPLGTTGAEDVKQSILVMHARAMEWRKNFFLDTPSEDKLARNALELASATRASAIIH